MGVVSRDGDDEKVFHVSFSLAAVTVVRKFYD